MGKTPKEIRDQTPGAIATRDGIVHQSTPANDSLGVVNADVSRTQSAAKAYAAQSYKLGDLVVESNITYRNLTPIADPGESFDPLKWSAISETEWQRNNPPTLEPVNVDDNVKGRTFQTRDSQSFFDGGTQEFASVPSAHSWDVSSAEFTRITTLAGTAPIGFHFRPNGKSYYYVDGNNAARQQNLTIPWNLSSKTASPTDVPLGTSGIEDLFWQHNGERLFYLFNENSPSFGSGVKSKDPPTPWNILSLTNEKSKEMSLTGNYAGLYFKPDGLTMYLLNRATNKVEEFALTTPYDVDTINTTPVNSIDIPANSIGLFFRSDGYRMYICDNNNHHIIEYEFGTPWEFTDETDPVITNTFSYSRFNDDARGLAFQINGEKLFIVGISTGVAEFDLGFTLAGKIGLGTRNPIHGLDSRESCSVEGSQPHNITGTVKVVSPNFKTVLNDDGAIPPTIFTKELHVGDKISIDSATKTTITKINSEIELEVADNQDAQTNKSLEEFPSSLTVFKRKDPGVTAEGTAVLDDDEVDTVTVDVAGSGYLSPPTVFIQSPTPGNPASATAQIGAGQVSGVNPALLGSKYDAVPGDIVTIAPPDSPPNIQATADAVVVGGQVTGYINIFGGGGYTVIPLVTIDPPTPGTIAKADATIVDGAVTVINVTDGGLKYSFAPAVSITPPLGPIPDIHFVANEKGEFGIGLVDTKQQLHVKEVIKTDAAQEFFDGTTQEYGVTPDFNDWHVSTGKFSTSILPTAAFMSGIYFKPDGTIFYFLDNNIDDSRVRQVPLSIPWDISSATTPTKDFPVDPDDNAPLNVFFRSDGLRMYLAFQVTKDVKAYTLDTPWDISTITDPPVVKNISGDVNLPSSIFFKPDGRTAFIFNSLTVSAQTLTEFSLAIPWDISTLVKVGTPYSFGSQFVLGGVFFKSDGRKIFWADEAGDDIHQVSLSIPWSLAGAITNEEILDISGIGGSPSGVFIKPDGRKLYLSDISPAKLNELDMGILADGTSKLNDVDVAGDLSVTGALDVDGDTTLDKVDIVETLDVVGDTTVAKLDVTGALDVDGDTTLDKVDIAETLDVVGDTTVAKLDVTNNLDVDGDTTLVKTDIVGAVDITGKVDITGDTDMVGDLDVTEKITTKNLEVTGEFEIDSFDVDTLKINDTIEYFDESTQEYGTVPSSIEWNVPTLKFDGEEFDFSGETDVGRNSYFKPDGTRMYILSDGTTKEVIQYTLSTPWDVTTASTPLTFPIAGGVPHGIFIRHDGLKMYIVLFTKEILEYDLGTPWLITSAVISANANTTVGVPNGIYFKPDGKKMFITETIPGKVIEYSLPVAWNISTINLVQEFVTSFTESQGLFFKSDGTKMYLDIKVPNQIVEFNLVEPWSLTNSAAILASISTFATAFLDSELIGIYIKPDGSKLFVIGRTTVKIYALELGISVTGKTLLSDIEATTIKIADNVEYFDNSTQEYAANPSEFDFHPSTAKLRVTKDLERFDTSGLFFSPDGLTLSLCGSLTTLGDDSLSVFTLTIPFDVTTAIAPENFSPGFADDMNDVFWGQDGLKLYLVFSDNATAGIVQEYDVINPFSLLGITLATSFTLSNLSIKPVGIFFNRDGKTLYVLDNITDSVYAYPLLVPWDLSTADNSSPTILIISDTDPHALRFRADGKRMYICGNNSGQIQEYDLEKPWDIITGTVKLIDTLLVSSFKIQDYNGVFVTQTGSKLFLIGEDNLTYELDLGLIVNGSIPDVNVGQAVEFLDSSTQEQASMPVPFVGNISTIKPRAKKATGLSNANGLFFKPDGKSYYTANHSSPEKLHQYNLSIPWDITTAVLGPELAVTVDDDIEDIFVRSDGRKLYTIQFDGKINQFNLPTPWVLTGGTIDQTVTIAADVDKARGIYFKPNGKKMFIINDILAGVLDHISEYSLDTPWDVSSLTLVDTFQLTSQGAGEGFAFKADGSKCYINNTTLGARAIDEYTLDEPWNLGSTGTKLTNSVSVNDLDPFGMTGIYLRPDTEKLYLVEFLGFNVAEIDLGLVVNGIIPDVNVGQATQYFDGSTQEKAPFGTPYNPDISSATVVNSKISGLINPKGLFFKPDGTKCYTITTDFEDEKIRQFDLGFPWNIATAVLDAAHLDTGLDQHQDIFIRHDGVKFFTVDFNNNLIEGTMSTPWDISTGVFNTVLSLSAQIIKTKGIYFKPDGKTFFIVGRNLGDTVDIIVEYALTTPWDINNRILVFTFTLPFIGYSEGLAFSYNGERFYIDNDTLNMVHEYILSTPWSLALSDVEFVNNLNFVEIDSTKITGVYMKPNWEKLYLISPSNNTIEELGVGMAVSGGVNVEGRFQEGKGAVIGNVVAGVLTLNSSGNYFEIPTSTTIDFISVVNWKEGSEIKLHFDPGTPTLTNKTASPPAGSLPLHLSGNVDFETNLNDIITLVHDGSNWIEISRNVTPSGVQTVHNNQANVGNQAVVSGQPDTQLTSLLSSVLPNKPGRFAMVTATITAAGDQAATASAFRLNGTGTLGKYSLQFYHSANEFSTISLAEMVELLGQQIQVVVNTTVSTISPNNTFIVRDILNVSQSTMTITELG